MASHSQPLRTFDMTSIALYSVFIAVCAWISVPMPPPFMPFTLQTFAVFLALTVLGGRRGMYAVLVYLLLGAAGLPVFTGFRGGLSVLLGVTGGYIVGFLFSALVYWGLTTHLKPLPWVTTLACIFGLLTCYIFGTAWYLAVYAHTTGTAGILSALSWCVFPFLLPDAIKLGIALYLSRRIKRFIH